MLTLVPGQMRGPGGARGTPKPFRRNDVDAVERNPFLVAVSPVSSTSLAAEVANKNHATTGDRHHRRRLHRRSVVAGARPFFLESEIRAGYLRHRRNREERALRFPGSNRGHGLTGTVKNDMGETQISDGEVEGTKVSFVEKIAFQGNEIVITHTGDVTSKDEIKFTRQVAEIATEQLVAKCVK